MNFYGISKFTAKITNESLKILFICVTGFADSPLELLFLLTRDPWPGKMNREGGPAKIRRCESSAARRERSGS